MRILLIVALALSVPAHAATFTVNSTSDPGTGICDIGECTLREAINAANAAAGTDNIAFAIPGAGPHTILIGSQLPAINAMTIDGYTQSGAAANTNSPAQSGLNAVIKIVVRGSNCVACIGLSLGMPPLVIRGLAIGGFPTSAIGDADFPGTLGTTNLRIEGNYIGLDANGTTVLTPVGTYGLRINR